MDDTNVALLFVRLILMVVFAVATGAVASSKGRNPWGWGVLGFFIGCIGLIIVACLPNLKEQAEKDRYVAEENRRLREQLRQERIKGESFRQHAAARLDAHDQHLGVDTRTLGPQLAAGSDASGQPMLGAAAGGSIGNNNDPRWYYGREGRTVGPVKLSEVLEMIRLQVITRETLVWSEELVEWQPAGQIPAFMTEFA